MEFQEEGGRVPNRGTIGNSEADFGFDQVIIYEISLINLHITF
jgi:hypothetical protein